MAKQVITSDQLYPVYGPYSHAVRAGDFIFLHGTVGLDPQGRLPGDTPDGPIWCDNASKPSPTWRRLCNSWEGVCRMWSKCGPSCPSTVVRHASANSPLMRPLTRSTGGISRTPRPARAALQQGLFQEDLLVEIEAIAVVNQPRRLIVSEALPPLRRPYAQGGILVGNFLFLRGFTSQDRHSDLVGRGDMRAQTTQTFANMAITLQEAGGSLADLVQTQVTLTDWHAYREYHEVYTPSRADALPYQLHLPGWPGA